jgi:Flp pilus assembly secretin CpaC
MNKLLSGAALLFTAILSVTAADAVMENIELIQGTETFISCTEIPHVQALGASALNVQYIPQKKSLVLSGIHFGSTQLIISDSNNRVLRRLDVKVYPKEWKLYRKILQNTPNIRLELGDSKLILSGLCSDADSVEKVRRIMEIAGENGNVVNNTDIDSTAVINEAQQFIREQKFNDIKMYNVNRTIFVSGEVYDKERLQQLIGLLNEFFSKFNCKVNTNALTITSKKIAMQIIFLDVDKSKLRQFGIKADSPIRWDWAFGKIMDHFMIGDNKMLKSGGMTGAIDILQQNNLAKVLYEVKLSTLSGQKASFQQGGMLNVRIATQDTSDVKEIRYGFIVDATPYTLDSENIALDFKMELTRPKNENSWTQSDRDKDLAQYTTQSKYTVKAGSDMILSSFGHNELSDKQSGLPWLSELPLVGSWLFGSTSAGNTDREILLILKVDWESNIQKELTVQKKRVNTEIQKVRTESSNGAESLRNAGE